MGYNRTLGHFTNSQELATVWASGQNYIVNQLVLDNNKLYRCITAHTSGATFAGDSAYWSGLNPGATVAISEGGTGQTTKTDAFDALAPTTTAGDLIVYNGTDNVRLPVGTDGQMIVADASQANKLKWATVPQGSKNYITYSNFENNATTGWSLFNTTLTSKIPTGSINSGAASLNALAISSSTPLAGSYSLSVTSPGAVAAGQGFITDPLTIDREDQAKVLTFSFYYETVSGTMDFSGTSANTWAIYIHDGTSWIQPAGVYGMTQSSGVGLVTGTFQTNATGTSYRLAVVCITATGAAISMKFDDFKLSPQTAPIGPVMTDWVNYTPTGTWTTNTAYSGKWRRVGDMMEGKIYISLTGAPNATNLAVNLPTGYTIDTTKYPAVANGYTVGNVYLEDYAITGYDGFSYFVSNTSIGVKAQDASAGFERASVVNATVPFTWGNQDYLSFDFKVPISGWSSQVQLSSDTDTRVVAFQSYSQPTATLSGSASLVRFTSFSSDTHAAFNTSTGFYTVPVSGYYKVSSGLNISGTFSANQYLTLYLAKNGSGFISNWVPTATGQTATQVSATGTVYCNAGDTIAPYAQTNIGSPSVTTNFTGSNYFTIERLSGPSVVASSESVSAAYYLTAAQSISSSDVQTIINFNQKDFDSHNAVTTGAGWKFTAPISGKYRISTSGMLNSAPWTAGNRLFVYVLIDGVAPTKSKKIDLRWVEVTASPELFFNGTTMVDLVAGQYIQIAAIQSNASAKPLSTSGSLSPSVEIERVGN